jgi:pimeloyl-ACP methyl ester carboxylesterase
MPCPRAGFRRATLGRLCAILVIVVLASALSGCRFSRTPHVPAGTLDEEPCTGITIVEAKCLTLSVPENHTTRRGRTIRLRIVVLPATSAERAADAVMFLAGGPGQAASEFVGDTDLPVEQLRVNRDVIFADQRGTGGSHPLLCEFYGPPSQPQSYFTAFLPADKVRACRSTLQGDADLTQYTTAASVEDIEAIRIALRHPQLTLMGGSYGTRLAMEYVRRYEPRVRAVVLDGPVTPRSYSPDGFGRLAQSALDALLSECGADDECRRAFPEIREEAREVFARLREAPATATVAHPSRGEPGVVTLTRDHVAEAVRYLLYSSYGASRVPLYLHQASRGDFAPIADFLIRWRARGTFDGLYLSITCAEDVPFVAADAAELDAPTFLGGYRVRQQRAACAEWPHGNRPADTQTPVQSAVPVLLLSGTLDPVTPPSNADVVARTLPQSLVIRVPSGGHSPAGLSGLDCLRNLQYDFVASASVRHLDTSCVTRIVRPGFVTSL